MNNQNFMNESMDLKKLFICLRQKLMLVIIITLIGALLSGAIYLFVREIKMPTQYQSFSKFYLQFIYDPSGEVEQFYNGYTWNDLLHGDPILNHVVWAAEELKDTMPAGLLFDGEALKEQLRDNVFKGEVLSDRRLLTVTFTTDNPEKTAIIQKIMEIGLINYAAGQHEIISMELIRSSKPALMVWDNNLCRAIIGGAVLFLLLALFALWFYYLLDNSLYTISDAEQRYPYPVAGILLKGEKATSETLYFAETKENLAYFLKDKPNPAYLSVNELPYPKGEELRGTDGVILSVPFGKRNGKETDRCVSFLKNQNVEIIALLIIEADKKFLAKYYEMN
ncbi:MAG: hypothetical protein FWG91_04850 [Lachnospiraceae bacterium]|nr:hypothetical protein [Lachnospiraceae bacterium]